jgi:ribonucleoside-diphosphate reductase alpha chain
MLDISAMHDSGWRQRLEDAVRKDGRSLRDISLEAELSHGYLHGILRDGKEPTLDRFAKICKVLNLSLSYALMGVDISIETEEIVRGLDSDPGTREAILALLKRPAQR